MLPNSIPNESASVKTPCLEENLNLIRKIVWSFAKKYGLDFDDLFQEACLSCVQALPQYNPQRGAFSTFIWHTTTNALRDLVNKNSTFERYHHLTEDFVLQEDIESATPTDIILANENFNEFWSLLSPEAQEICNMVLSDKSLYKQTRAGNYRRQAYLPTDKPRRCRAVIRQILEQQGWTKTRIRQAFREITVNLGT